MLLIEVTEMKKTATLGVVLVMVGLAQAQQPDLGNTAKIAMGIAEARTENQQLTRQYSWTSRTEVKVKGEVKSLKTEIVRYTVDGELQKTPIGTPIEAKKKRGVRGKVQKKKVGEMKEWGRELGALLKQYSLPSPGHILDYLNAATIGPGEEPGTVRIFGQSVVQEDDKLTMWADSANKQLKKTKVETKLEEDTVYMDTDHARTEGGLNYVARTIIRVPSKQVEMIVENFNYDKQ
jgi:hypothetical protein